MWRGVLGRIGENALDFLVPPACPACGRTLPAPGEDLCAGCAAVLRELPLPRCGQCGGAADSAVEVCGECLHEGPRPWRHAVSVFPYGGAVRDMVHRFKYRRQSYLAGFLGRRMAKAWEAHGTGVPELLVPVPLHLWRRLWRGYNQAGLLAAEAGRILGLPVVPALLRTRATRRQALLDIDRRKANVRGVFASRPRWSVAGRHVLLLDDVLTTGHTLGEATRALRAAVRLPSAFSLRPEDEKPMPLFRKTKYSTLRTPGRSEIPAGLWKKCAGCDGVVYTSRLDENNQVCPLCGFHYPLTRRAAHRSAHR